MNKETLELEYVCFLCFERVHTQHTCSKFRFHWLTSHIYQRLSAHELSGLWLPLWLCVIITIQFFIEQFQPLDRISPSFVHSSDTKIFHSTSFKHHLFCDRKKKSSMTNSFKYCFAIKISLVASSSLIFSPFEINARMMRNNWFVYVIHEHLATREIWRAKKKRCDLLECVFGCPDFHVVFCSFIQWIWNFCDKY